MAKQSLVSDVFDKVANKYDIMNSVMSLGMHHIWKRQFISMIEPYHTHSLLDVAGGTGDIAMGFLDKGGGSAIICDINPNMLAAGDKQRIENGRFNRYKGKLTTLCANVESLPLQDKTFDRVTISFGIRNVESIQQGLNEMFRVLKVDGKFLCMEFMKPESETLMRKVYDFYSFSVIPRFGKMIVGDRAPYDYLVESIRAFPAKDDFVQMIKNAGFEMVKVRVLVPDVVAIYTAYRLA